MGQCLQAGQVGQAEKAKGGVGDAMSLDDGVVGSRKTMCVISFPGKYQAEWNNMVGLVKLLQAMDKDKGRMKALQDADKADGGKVERIRAIFSTACIFLPHGDERWGKHARNERDGDACYCLKLYGEKKEWGCQWFVEWDRQLTKARELEQDLVVVYKEGEVGQGDDGRWGELSRFTTEAKGLGGSQRGEVAWAKARNIEFRKMDVAELANKISARMVPNLFFACGGTRVKAAESLAEGISNCAEARVGLQSLNLSGVFLMDDGIQVLAPVLPSLQNLRHLRFGRNNFQETGLRAVASALSKMPQLESVDLNWMVARGVLSQTFAPVLPSLTSLKHLSLISSSLWEEEYRPFATVPNLQVLELSERFLAPGNLKALAPVLPSFSNLRHLMLSGSPSTSAPGSMEYHTPGLDSVRVLAEVLPRLSSLQILDLARTTLGDADVQALAPALPGPPNLRQLLFGARLEIGGAGIQALASALPKMPSLQILDLGSSFSLRPDDLEPLRKDGLDIRRSEPCANKGR